MSEDRKQKKLDLLRNAVDNNRGRGAPQRGGGAPGGGGGGGNNQIMYRGKPVGRGSGGGAPGSPGGANGQGQRPTPEGGGSNDGGDVKGALRKLTQLFNDGLINKSEFEAKKAEILNRL